MKNIILLILSTFLLIGCGNDKKQTQKETKKPFVQQAVFTPQFDIDYVQCGAGLGPLIDGNSVTFNPGRVVSTNGYKNISKIEATIDLSGLNGIEGWNGNFVNAAFYMVSSAKQPKGDNYCDAGGSAPYCDEIDFLETNGNKIFQQTVHLNNKQRYEYSFTKAADNECYNWDIMKNDPANGLHSIVDYIDVNSPFDVIINFASDYSNITMTLSQDTGRGDIVVYDMIRDGGAEGSDVLDMSELAKSMEVGWWLTPSYWQGYSPKGPGSAPWWTDKCSWDNLCGSNGKWKLSNVKVTAESSF